MGAADIVPGVSGGTIAFITGIYETLIAALKNILPEFIALISHRSIQRFWLGINGYFLLALFSGILVSVISLSNVISYFLTSHPIPLWSFFFGLIVASVFLIGREVDFRKMTCLVLFLFGVVLAVLISLSSPPQMEQNLATVFFSGAIAICAMILPGISGSFILVMLGSYTAILAAVKNFDVVIIGVFATGCVVGLLSIANVLSWAFLKHRQWILSLLTGFMVGALTKVWPWKEVLTYREDRHGVMVPLMQTNVLPERYEALNGLDGQVVFALFCMIFAIALVVSVDRIARINEK